MKVNKVLNSPFRQTKTTNEAKNDINFTGMTDKVADVFSKHAVKIAGLAGASVIAQKIVMSGSEALIGPVIDIGVGKAITKATDEKDGRTNQSSKVQAIRTFSQSVGGTITGVIIRAIFIGASALAVGKIASNPGNKLYNILNPDKIPEKELYKFANIKGNWGKAIGGAVATIVMLFTNFIIDAPFINRINKSMTNLFDGKNPKKEENNVKEAK